MKDLEKLKVIPADSENLSQTFHSYGVNMRHLGKVTEKTGLPHIKEICIVEMAARSSKKILRSILNEYILY